jgi:hypothetical protein
MAEWSRRAGIKAVGILPERTHMDGKLFDPRKHFREWRERQDDWSAGKDQRVAAAMNRARALRADSMT